MRLRGIGPEVLLLCFLIVGAAAFALGRRSARGRRLRRDIDYFTGLDHLVNDRFDRATEVFTRLATKSQEADIQFALGSLMRKRGEVDRAIAIHTELAAHRRGADREQATFALGLDYLSAGLMDRAEEKLRSLMGSQRYRPAVLEKLAWVYEQQREWRRRSTCGASCRPRNNANAPSSPRTIAASSAKRRSPRVISPAPARRLPRPRVHAPDSARASFSRRASRPRRAMKPRHSRCIPRRSVVSRTMLVAFEAEAREALKSRAARSRLPASASAAARDRAARAAAVPLRGVWSRQHHLALALPELPQLGFAAKHE